MPAPSARPAVVAISWGSCGSQSDPPIQRMDENTSQNVLTRASRRAADAAGDFPSTTTHLASRARPWTIHRDVRDHQQRITEEDALKSSATSRKMWKSCWARHRLSSSKEIKTMTSTNKKKKKASASNATPTPEKSARRKRNDLFLNPWPKDVEGKLHNRVRAAVHGGMKRLGRLARQQLKFQGITSTARRVHCLLPSGPTSDGWQIRPTATWITYLHVIDEKSGIGMIKIIDLVKFEVEVPGSSPRAQTVLSPEASGSVKAGKVTSPLPEVTHQQRHGPGRRARAAKGRRGLGGAGSRG